MTYYFFFSWNCLNNNSIIYSFSPTSSHLHSLQVENFDSNSRLVVDEGDNGKLRPERDKINMSVLLPVCSISQSTPGAAKGRGTWTVDNGLAESTHVTKILLAAFIIALFFLVNCLFLLIPYNNLELKLKIIPVQMTHKIIFPTIDT